MKSLKSSLLLCIIVLVPACLFAGDFQQDTIKSYKATYDAETSPFFMEVNPSTLSVSSGTGTWASLIGTLEVQVNRSIDTKNDQSASKPEDDDSAYVKVLYFRDNDTTHNKAVLYLEEDPNVTFTAYLYTKVASVHSGNSLIATPVKVYGNLASNQSKDYFTHLLPAAYRSTDNKGIAIYSPGTVKEDAWLDDFTVEFWLVIDGAVSSDYDGKDLYIDQEKSSFSSISTLAIGHNYKPQSFS
ncbi:MAG: hypothetical protein PHO44_04430 [Sphaerochaetaceae bacterium]|nr:hypothetical protein [Sphaerochaetaceae bacterium]MDD4007206.1 hypothetical protein [Sphaerochaetaceae bacterium]